MQSQVQRTEETGFLGISAGKAEREGSENGMHLPCIVSLNSLSIASFVLFSYHISR